MAASSLEPLPSPSPQLPAVRHKTFWFDDAQTIFHVNHNSFRIHTSLLARQSPAIAELLEQAEDIDKTEGCKSVVIKPYLNVSAEDFVVLLEHLYHDAPLTAATTFPRLAAILRVTSPRQLHFPSIHVLARSLFEAKIPPDLSVNPIDLDLLHLEEALAMASLYDISSTLKSLHYAVVTNSDFDTEHRPEDADTNNAEAAVALAALGTAASASARSINEVLPPMAAPQRHKLSPAAVVRCRSLMDSLIAHFTPILFTPPAASHMECTDVFADRWMPQVIQPALDNAGVYRPLETLEQVKAIDWRQEGICEACEREKREEWSEEQRTVWKLMDSWLAMPIPSVA